MMRATSTFLYVGYTIYTLLYSMCVAVWLHFSLPNVINCYLFGIRLLASCLPSLSHVCNAIAYRYLICGWWWETLPWPMRRFCHRRLYVDCSIRNHIHTNTYTHIYFFTFLIAWMATAYSFENFKPHISPNKPSVTQQKKNGKIN